jgi:two-component system chemotaxis response regulator CheY
MKRTLTVLVVDDSAAMRTLVETLLVAGDHVVLLAEDVAQALEILDVHRPDLILTDYSMPGANGADLVGEIRSRAAFAHTPVFVISSEQAPETRNRMARVGANGWISKPLCVGTLLAAVDAVAVSFVRQAEVLRASPMPPIRAVA